MKLDISRLNDIDLTKIVYPICLFITIWYAILNIFHLQGWDIVTLSTQGLYITAYILVALGFMYLLFKKVKLKFRWSVLSVIGMILIIVFVHEAVSLFLNPAVNLIQDFLAGKRDHTFYPIAFGFFFLCDLRKLPKNFWLFFLLFATLAVLPINLNIISNVFFDKWAFHFPAPGFFSFFPLSSNKMSEVLALPQQRLVHGLIEYLHEQLTFMSLFPIVILYYLAKAMKEKRSKLFDMTVFMVIAAVWSLLFYFVVLPPNIKIIVYLLGFTFFISWLFYYFRKEKYYKK